MMKILFTVSVSVLLLMTAVFPQQQSVEALSGDFETSAKEFNIPAGLLKSIAYVETRFHNEIPSKENESNMPPVYGIMGLRNDSWFGHSLIEAAELIGANPDVVAVNESLNIQAAAALLSSFADSLKIDRSDINNWRPVIEKYSGIPQNYVKPFYSYEVFNTLSKGEILNGIKIPENSSVSLSQFPLYVKPNGQITKLESVQSTDYPPAEWTPSPNFTKGNIHQLFLVVHVTQETFAGTISLFLDPNYQASSHYLIRSSDGKVVQFVREDDEAWHARCWNPYMIGVEHEGWIDQPQWFTEAMYKSSADLFRHFAETYDVPVDSLRIIGHYQWTKSWWVNWVDNVWNPSHPSASFDPTCNNHTDPGPYWNWTHFFNLIKQGAEKPEITSFTPNQDDTVWSTAGISINFNQSMDTAATRAAFHISPQVSGNFNWANGGKKLTFIPESLLSPAAKYTVLLDSSAVSILNYSTDSILSFNFYTEPAIPLSVINTYPADKQKNISTTVKTIVEFNTPLFSSGFDKYIQVQDSADNSVRINNPVYYTSDNKGYLSFSTYDPLNYNSWYKIIVKSGIQNVFTSSLGNNFTFAFKTGSNIYVKGTIIENFVSAENWLEPSLSSGSKDIDTNKTKFIAFYGTSPEGSHLGKLTYKFTQDSDGVCNLLNTNKPVINSSGTGYFGLWVYGDLSNNNIGGLFSVSGNNEESIMLDTLNWTGWKFVKIPFTKIISQQPGGEIVFNGIYIKKNISGEDSNQVSFAGVQYYDSLSTAIKNNSSSTIPDKIELDQNYPNPFNPDTQIKFGIPKSGFVKLEVYNLLGQNIATLINEVMNAGYHIINFSGKYFSSGVYIYTLSEDNFKTSRKMILLK